MHIRAEKAIQAFETHLYHNEKAKATIDKYLYHVRDFLFF